MYKIIAILSCSLMIINCDKISDDTCNNECWLRCISDKQSGKKGADVNCDEECPIESPDLCENYTDSE